MGSTAPSLHPLTSPSPPHQHTSAMNSYTKIVFLCYLIFSPAVLSLPQQVAQKAEDTEEVAEARQGAYYTDYTDPAAFLPVQQVDRQAFELPENLLPVAAVGFIAGLAGSLFSATTTTTTTSTTTAATTTT